MTDDLTARCREALLKACPSLDEWRPFTDKKICTMIDVDDAAACMARAIQAAGCTDSREEPDAPLGYRAAALAAAQEVAP